MTEATTEAEKHACRCEALAALLMEARGKLERARAVEAERTRAAEAERTRAAEAERARAEAVEAAAAAEAERARAEAEAAERLQLEQRLAQLSLEVQAVQARLGGVPRAPAEEAQCVVCMDARKDHIVLPCLHLCACGACAQHLLKRWPPRCPVCRGAIERIGQVFT
jgi:hypothetical protein